MVILVSCSNTPNSNAKFTKPDSIEFSVKKMLTKIKDNGKFYDSCQFLYQGNCLYKLCAPAELMASSDTTFITQDSRCLVKYTEKPKQIIYNNENAIQVNNEFQIYSHVLNKNIYNNIVIEEFIKNDVAYAMKLGQIVSQKSELRTADFKTAYTYQYEIPKTKQLLAVAYIDVYKYIVQIVLSANNKSEYDTNYNHFVSIVHSFEYYGD